MTDGSVGRVAPYSVNEAIDQAAHLAGRTIRIVGQVSIGVENMHLAHLPPSERRPAGQRIPWASVIWLQLSSKSEMARDAAPLSMQRVVVTGRITGTDPPSQAYGHLGLFGADLEVLSIEPAPPA